MLKVYVINLERAQDRRESISQQLAQQNISFEFYPAVDGRLDKSYAQTYYRNFSRLIRYARPLSDSQIGGFASHYKLWLKCIELNQPIVILEDDIYLKENFAEKLEFCFTKISKYHYLRFMGVFPRAKYEVEPGIECYIKTPTGAQGYMLDPVAAQKFIQFANKLWIEPVDNYMDRFWLHGMRPYVLAPEIIYTPHLFESSIVNNSKPKKYLKLLEKFISYLI